MDNTLYLKTISDLYKFLNLGYAQHPLIAVIDFGSVVETLKNEIRINTDFYSVMFKNDSNSHIRYGRKTFDFQEGSLVCISPNNLITIDYGYAGNQRMVGWGLFFHPDLIRGTSLGQKMKAYTFFSYEMSEALHLSEKEKIPLQDCLSKIQLELRQNLDNYSETLIISNIELFLNYCSRFYGRQFITRKTANLDVVAKVENILLQYFDNDRMLQLGMPTVKFLANEVNLSPSYLSDLLKKETGLNAQDRIHHFLIEQAKNSLLQTNHSVSEIAYSLGFEYPQYFSRLFKLKTGQTPLEFRHQNAE